MNLLMEMALGGGKSLMAGGQMMQGVNDTTKASFGAQGFGEYLQQLLKGGGQVNLGKDKFTISGTPDLLMPKDPNQTGVSGVAGGNPGLHAAANPPVTQPSTVPGVTGNTSSFDNTPGGGNQIDLSKVGFLQQLIAGRNP